MKSTTSISIPSKPYQPLSSLYRLLSYIGQPSYLESIPWDPRFGGAVGTEDLSPIYFNLLRIGS